MLNFADVTWLADSSLPVRVLLAIVITAVGAFGSGLIVQMLSKTVTGTKAPGPAVNVVRLTGAVAAGYAAILLLFGTGGGFGFGGGGSGKGTGKDSDGKGNASFSDTIDDKKKEREDAKSTGPDTPAGEEILRIEVLGNRTVRKLADQKAVEENRRYRIPADSETKLLTLDEIVEYISQRSRKSRAPDRLHLISYKPDTRPQDKTTALERLQELGKDLGKDKVKGGWIKSDDLDQMPSG